MEYIIRKFPQATIVFPHFGDGHEYEHIFKRIDLVARNKDCCLDTSGYGHDRVLFGSDFSINCPATVLSRIENAFITVEQKQKILAGNLLALLKRVQA